MRGPLQFLLNGLIWWKNASRHLGDQTQRCACAICVRASCWKRVINKKPPILHIWCHGTQKRWFLAHNSWSTQDKHIKVYIFEISVKFRVDWYATWGVLKKLNFFVSSRMLVHKWRMRIFVLDPPDGGWHFFIKLDHLTKTEGGPAVIWQKWPYCFHPTYI